MKIEKPTIDNVTVTNLDLALRMVNIQLAPELIDKIIDLVELIERQSNDVSIQDILDLQAEWNKLNELKRPT